MDNIRSLHFDGCISTSIEQTCRHLDQVYERLVGPTGLSVLEWHALRALFAEDGLSASRLACEVCRHPSSMTGLLDRMEEKDLLRRETDRVDRRSVRVFLTDRGRSYRAQVESVSTQIEELLTNHITPEQLATFQYVLSVLQQVPVPQEE